MVTVEEVLAFACHPDQPCGSEAPIDDVLDSQRQSHVDTGSSKSSETSYENNQLV